MRAECPAARRTFAQEVREARLNAGLTQLELAVRLGVSPATVYRWEAGYVTPSPMAIQQLQAVVLRLESDAR